MKCEGKGSQAERHSQGGKNGAEGGEGGVFKEEAEGVFATNGEDRKKREAEEDILMERPNSNDKRTRISRQKAKDTKGKE